MGGNEAGVMFQGMSGDWDMCWLTLEGVGGRITVLEDRRIMGCGWWGDKLD